MMKTVRHTIGTLVPVTQAAHVLNRSRKQVYRLIDEGKLRAEQHGPRATLVVRDSIVEVLQHRGATVELQGDELTVTEEEEARRRSA